MNRMFVLRLPSHPILRALAVIALAALAVVLFFLGAVIWLTVLAVGLVAALILRLFGGGAARPPPSAPGRGDVIEGEYKVLDRDEPKPPPPRDQ